MKKMRLASIVAVQRPFRVCKVLGVIEKVGREDGGKTARVYG